MTNPSNQQNQHPQFRLNGYPVEVNIEYSNNNMSFISFVPSRQDCSITIKNLYNLNDFCIKTFGMPVKDYWELQTGFNIGSLGFPKDKKKDLQGNFFSAKGCRITRMDANLEKDFANSITIDADYIVLDDLKIIASKRIKKLK